MLGDGRRRQDVSAKISAVRQSGDKDAEIAEWSNIADDEYYKIAEGSNGAVTRQPLCDSSRARRTT